LSTSCQFSTGAFTRRPTVEVRAVRAVGVGRPEERWARSGVRCWTDSWVKSG